MPLMPPDSEVVFLKGTGQNRHASCKGSQNNRHSGKPATPKGFWCKCPQDLPSPSGRVAWIRTALLSRLHSTDGEFGLLGEERSISEWDGNVEQNVQLFPFVFQPHVHSPSNFHNLEKETREEHNWLFLCSDEVPLRRRHVALSFGKKLSSNPMTTGGTC